MTSPDIMLNDGSDPLYPQYNPKGVFQALDSLILARAVTRARKFVPSGLAPRWCKESRKPFGTDRTRDWPRNTVYILFLSLRFQTYRIVVRFKGFLADKPKKDSRWSSMYCTSSSALGFTDSGGRIGRASCVRAL